MKILLQEQWDRLLAELEAKKGVFLAHVLSEHPQPSVMYSLESYRTIRELRVDRVDIWIGLPWVEKRPTKKAVASLSAIVGGFNPTLADVSLFYSSDHTSGAIRLPELLSGERYATTRDDLIPKQQEMIEKHAPREGYAPCRYCGTQRPERDMVDYTVIAQQYPNMRMVARYCNATCGVHNQMAHEG